MILFLLPFLLLRISPQQFWPLETYVTFSVAWGSIGNWRLGSDSDDWQRSPYHIEKAYPPSWLFAALCDSGLGLSKMSNWWTWAIWFPELPARLKKKFKEKIYCRKRFLNESSSALNSPTIKYAVEVVDRSLCSDLLVTGILILIRVIWLWQKHFITV